MADNQFKISSAEEVAYNLMQRIANQETKTDAAQYLKPDARTYYLTLFNQCMKAANSANDIGDILGDRKPQDESPGSFSSRSY